MWMVTRVVARVHGHVVVNMRWRRSPGISRHITSHRRKVHGEVRGCAFHAMGVREHWGCLAQFTRGSPHHASWITHHVQLLEAVGL